MPVRKCGAPHSRMAPLSAWKWLCIPGLGLLATNYLMQFIGWCDKNGSHGRGASRQPTRRNRNAVNLRNNARFPLGAVCRLVSTCCPC